MIGNCQWTTTGSRARSGRSPLAATRLFAGSLRAGQRAAAVMSTVQSARMNGRDPYAYLKDVLARLPTRRASWIEKLLPHRSSQPANSTMPLQKEH